MRALVTLLGVSVVLVGCLSRSASQGQDSCFEGIARVRGPTRSVTTWVVSDSGEVRVDGDLEREIRQLGGGVLEVCGVVEEQAMAVASYDLRQMAGRPARAGVLYDDGGEWIIDSQHGHFQLIGSVPNELRSLEGKRVWVAGPVEGSTIRVESFGVIQPE